MTPVPPNTLRNVRRFIAKQGEVNVFQVRDVIKERGYEWPSKRVTMDRVASMLFNEMSLHRTDIGWRLERPPLQERAAEFVGYLEREKSSVSGYDGAEQYAKGEGRNEAIDEAIERFKSEFPDLFPQEAA